MLKKARQENTSAIRRYFQGGMHKKKTEIRRQSTILAKKKSGFSLVSFLEDTIVQLRELNGYITPNIGFFVRQRPEYVDALKQCLKMRNAHLAETQQSLIPIRPQHQQRQRQNQQFERGENFDYELMAVFLLTRTLVVDASSCCGTHVVAAAQVC